MRRIATAVCALAMLLGLVSVMPTTATADTGQSCAQELKLPRPTSADAASKTPVILVHGLWSKAGMWADGSPSMRSVLEGVSQVSVSAFDYESANNRWVTEGGTDQRLAKTIVCYSKLYGGKKVIIVAHSMGGLLTRAALDWAAYGTFAKKAVGHVITLGTPHTGANVASITSMLHDAPCELGRFWYGEDAYHACQQVSDLWATSAMHPGSSELKALPRFPAGITVRAIAGDVSVPVSCVPWSCPLVDTKSDLVVPVSSATDEYTSTGVGDGKKIYSCNGVNAIEPISLAWCSHGNLTKAPQVQADVKASIQAYLASLQPKKLPLPPHTEYKFFTRFTLPFLNTWDTSMSEPNSVLNVVDRGVCSADAASCPHIYFIDLTSSYGKQTYGNDPVAAESRTRCEDAQGQGAASVGSGQGVTVGGVAARYYPEIKCANGESYAQAIWYVPSKQLMVTSPSADVGPSFDYNGLRAVLDNIEWLS